MHMALPTVLGFANRKKKRETQNVKKREQQITKGSLGRTWGQSWGSMSLGEQKEGKEAGVPGCLLFLKPREGNDRATKFFLSAWLFLSLPGYFQHQRQYQDNIFAFCPGGILTPAHMLILTWFGEVEELPSKTSLECPCPRLQVRTFRGNTNSVHK